MNIEQAYHYLYLGALIWISLLISAMLIRSIIGPAITDRILSINMIGTMIICCILILSQLMDESFLLDVALIYAMISFISVLILASVYIPAKPPRGRFAKEEKADYDRERAAMRRHAGKNRMADVSDMADGKEE